MDALRELFVRVRSVFDSEGVDKANKATNDFVKNAKSALSVFGAGFTFRGLAGFVTETTHAADAIGDTAFRLGIATDTLQEWGFVAEDAGVSTENLQRSLLFLNAQLGKAQLGEKGASKTFAKLGIDVGNSSKGFTTLSQVLEQLPNTLNKFKSSAQQAAVARNLLGRGGAQLARVLAKNGKEIQENTERLRKLGGIINERSLETFDRLDRRLRTAQKGFFGTKVAIVEQLSPAINFVLSIFEKGLEIFNKVNNAIGITTPLVYALAAGLTLLGIRGAAAFAPLLLRLIPVIAKLAILGLIIDDIVTTFQGGDSVVRRFVDALFGVGATAKAIEIVKNAFSGLLDFVSSSGLPILKRFISFLAAPFVFLKDSLLDVFNIGKSILSLFSGDFKGAAEAFTNIKNPFKSSFDFLNDKESRISAGLPLFGATGLEAKPHLFDAFGRDITNTLPGMAAAVSSPGISNTNTTNAFGPRVNNVNATINVTSNNPEEVMQRMKDFFSTELSDAWDANVQEAE